MRNSTGPWLLVIAALTILCLFFILANPTIADKNISPHPGLDIQGGLSVLLKADPGADLSGGKLEVARQIIERRVNALGVSEPVVQIAGSDEIVVEIPGIKDPKAAIKTVQETGLLEFVNFSNEGCPSTLPTFPTTGQYVLTDRQVKLAGSQNITGATPATGTTPTATALTPTATFTATPTALPTDILFKRIEIDATVVPTTEATAVGTQAAAGTQAATQSAAATSAATAAATATGPLPRDGSSKERALLNPCTNQPFLTIMTGSGLQNASSGVGGSATNQYVVNFQLAGNDESAAFGTFTGSHIGQPMAIVLDGKVLSAPTIQAALTTGGQITGNFTKQAAEDLALQLQYGSLPVPLHIESTQTVGASLGSSSVQASVRAGIIGIIMVLLFMLVYYRIPGVAAVLALLLFILINIALYEFIPVTLTLPSIVGFLISTGAAVDGNILIFERIKEELREGRPFNKAVELGFARAWPSIRDSNISTILIGFILYFFGGTFGASAVRGFAVTLILGLVTNLFTAIIVTRTLLNVVLTVGGDALRRANLFGA